jgi:hypothetical protein
VKVIRRRCQAPVCDPVTTLQFILERDLYRRVRRKLRTLFELVVLREKIKLENLQPVEFSKQIRRCIGDWPHGIVRMSLLPLREGLVRPCEIQVVHLLEAVVQVNRRWEIGRERCACEAEDYQRHTGAPLQREHTARARLRTVSQAKWQPKGCYRCERWKESKVVLPIKILREQAAESLQRTHEGLRWSESASPSEE